MHDIRGRWVLVTGASSGMGEEFARQIAMRGAHVALVARREDRLRALADELCAAHGIQAAVYPTDLTAPNAIPVLAAAVEADGHDIFMLVNNAGMDVIGSFVAADWDKLREMIRLNTFAITELTKHYAQTMAARGSGIILNVASLGGQFPMPYHAVYGGTKAFMLNLTEAFGYELRDSGVSVTAAAPGLVLTEMFVKGGMVPPRWREIAYYMPRRMVVRACLRAALKGKPQVVPGLFYKTLALFGRFVPRWFQTWFARELMRG